MNIAVIGAGHVGAALLRQLHGRAERVAREAGEPVTVLRAAVREPEKPRDCPDPVFGYTRDVGQLLQDARVDVLVEVAGGEHWLPALSTFLRSGRPVVTANKALLARHGPVLFSLAREHGAPIRFEAAVGGAMPIIRILLDARRVDHLSYVGGVLNGTANFLLDRIAGGVPYEAALEEARRAGLAEEDPSDDVEGLDAARKLSILAQLAFGTAVPPEMWPRAGIARLSPRVLQAVLHEDERVKLLAEAWRTEDGITGYVGPVILPASAFLARPSGAENAVVLDGNPGGPTALMGLGAGGDATASQVVADLVSVARSRRAGVPVDLLPAEPATILSPRLRARLASPDARTLEEFSRRLPPPTPLDLDTGVVGPLDARALLALAASADVRLLIARRGGGLLGAPPVPL